MSRSAKIKIALVGSPFSGKTTVLNEFKKLGVKTLNSDDFIHNFLYKKNNKGYKLIKEYFGSEYVNKDEVDRKKLSTLVLTNPEKLDILNKLIHPLIFEEIDKYKNILVEAPVVFFTNDKIKFDKLILVKASKEKIIERLNNKKRKINEDFIKKIIEKWENASNNFQDIIDTTNGIDLNLIKKIVKQYNLKDEK